MKRLTILLTGVLMVGAVALATAGDFHVGTTLICSDCHVAHYSQAHSYSGSAWFPGLGTAGPYNNLLRDDENKVCLACHNGSSYAPDVFGANGGVATIRQAGALNTTTGHGLSNDPTYDEIDGHTLYSTALPPGKGTSAYVPKTDGLTCVDCHAQHGIATQYRNLLNRGIFAGDSLTYAIGTNNLIKDVYERAAGLRDRPD